MNEPTDEQLKEHAREIYEALLNMMGAFDTSVRRRKMPGEFNDDAIATGRKIIRTLRGDHADTY